MGALSVLLAARTGERESACTLWQEPTAPTLASSVC